MPKRDLMLCVCFTERQLVLVYVTLTCGSTAQWKHPYSWKQKMNSLVESETEYLESLGSF